MANVNAEISASEMSKQWYAVTADYNYPEDDKCDYEDVEGDYSDNAEDYIEWNAEEKRIDPALQEALASMDKTVRSVKTALKEGIETGQIAPAVLSSYESLMKDYKDEYGALVFASNSEEAIDTFYDAYDSPQDTTFHILL